MSEARLASLVLAAVFVLTIAPARAQSGFLGTLIGTSMALSLMPQQARGFSVRVPDVASQPLISFWSIADPLVEHPGSQIPGECLLKPRKLPRQPVEQCRQALDSLLQLDEPQRASDPADFRDIAQSLEFAKKALSKSMRLGPSKVEERASAFRIAWEAAQFEAAVRIASAGLQVAVETAAGPADPEIAVALTMLGDACAAAGEMEPAGRMFTKAADIARAGRRTDVLAGAMIGESRVLRSAGKLPAARARLEEVIAVAAREKLSTITPIASAELAGLDQLDGLISSDIDLQAKAPAIPEANEDPTIAVRDELFRATLARESGDLKAAHAFLRDAGDRHSRAGSPGALLTLEIKIEEARQATALGDVAAAEQTIRTVVRRAQELFGGSHPWLAGLHAELGLVLMERAAVDEAIGELSVAVDIYQGRDPRPIDAVLAEHHLADALAAAARYDCAEPRYRAVLAAWRDSVGNDHALSLRAEAGLATLARARGQLTEAEQRLLRILRAETRRLGVSHPIVGRLRINLAELRLRQGHSEEAARYFDAGLAILEQALGGEHPDLAVALFNRATLRLRTGDTEGAVADATRAIDIRNQSTSRLLAYGSTNQRVATARQLAAERSLIVSFRDFQASHRAELDTLIAQSVVSSKGRVFDASAKGWAAARQVAGGVRTRLTEEWQSTSRELAVLGLSYDPAPSPEERSQRIDGLLQHLAAIERELLGASILEETTSNETGESLSVWQAALPAGAVLLDFVRFSSLSPATLEPAGTRYGVIVQKPHGTPRFVDLGPAEAMEISIILAHRALRREDSRADELLAEVSKQVIGPVLGDILSSRHLVIVPDGELNLIPFGALPIDERRNLVESHRITYLSSTRDLAGAARSGPIPREAPLILAAPEYGEASSRDDACAFQPLPGAEAEAHAIADLAEEANLVIGAAATAERLRAVSGPAWLHLATHGFTSGTAYDVACHPQLVESGEAALVGSLLRSGLAFAGANSSAGQLSGILSGLDAVSLDLQGTEFVVLSACETGLGRIEAGEGVFGLRRAFALAGARTLIMSLWPVRDRATALLMERFYRNLNAGTRDPAEALRAAQQEVRTIDGLEHPRHWAAFVAFGRPAVW